MDRRSFVAATAAAAAPALAAPAIAQTQSPEVRWRLQSSFGRNLDILFFGAEQVSKRVAELTDNRFQIRAFPAGEIAPALQVLDAVQNGTIECGQTPLYWYIGKDPALSFFTSVPFGGNYRQQGAWMKRGGGNEMCAEMLREFNCVGFLLGDTGAQMGGWFRSEVRALSDLNGLKFRIAGMGGQVFQRLGVSPALIAGADVYPSLERGVIDAAEWVGPHDDEKLGFQRVARFYYAPGFWEPCARGHLVINQRAWEPLPDAYKAAIQVACIEVELEMVARYDLANPVALRRLVGGGAQLRAWPREVLQAAWRAAHGARADGGERGQERALQADLGKLPPVPRRPVPMVPRRGERLRQLRLHGGHPLAAARQGHGRPSKARARACHIGLRRNSASSGRGRAGPPGADPGAPVAFSAGVGGGWSVAQL